MQRHSNRSQQRGMSFLGVILIGLLAVAAFAIGGQSVPIFLEYAAAKKAIEKAKAGNTVPEVRAIFDRAAAIDDIHSVSSQDLDITKNGDRVTVGFKYTREIPLVGPAYLTYHLQAQTK